jgi:hypothetical protein
MNLSYRRVLILTHRRYRATTAALRPRGREAKGADAPALKRGARPLASHTLPAHNKKPPPVREGAFGRFYRHADWD